MQGFTIAGNSLLFCASKNGESKGEIYKYDLDGNLKGYYEGDIGHGNSVTYAGGNVYIAGADGYNSLFKFNPTKLGKNTLTESTTNNSIVDNYTTIAYNSVDKTFYGKKRSRIYETNGEFVSVKSVFNNSATETKQGMEIKNGYLYVPTYEIGSECSKENTFQLYCYGEKYSGTIYVYNVKYNDNKEKSPNYGRLVARFSIPSTIGEVEDVSFDSNYMYLNFAAKDKSTYPFVIFRIPYETVSFEPSIKVSYKDGNTIISSDESLKSISGWTKSDNGRKLTKKTLSSDTSVKVCDRYSNCKTVTLKKQDTITLNNTSAKYSGKVIKASTAKAKSGTSITYKYYKDSECSGDEVKSVINAGTYYVKATSAGNSSYAPSSVCKKLTVSKVTPAISLTKKTSNYIGKAISTNTPEASYNSNSVTLKYTYTFYTDDKCKTAIANGEGGVTKKGGSPIYAGKYYVKAKSTSTTNYNSAYSKCVEHKINKIKPKISSKKSLTMMNTETENLSISFTGESNITCKVGTSTIADCNVNNNKLLISAISPGNTTITLSSSESTNYIKADDFTISLSVQEQNVEDDIGPNVSISYEGENEYIKSYDVHVNIEDKSGIAGNQNVYYAWSDSNEVAPTFDENNKIELILGTDITKAEIIVPVSTSNELNGIYYLWIKEGIKDTNNKDSEVFVSKKFMFKNKEVELEAVLIRSDKKVKVLLDYNENSNVKKVEYSIDNVNYIEINSKTFIIDSVDSLFIRVTAKDNTQKVTEINDFIDESEPEINMYLLSSNGEYTNNILLNENEKDTFDYNIELFIPYLDDIISKYSMVESKIDISDKLNIEEDSIIIKSEDTDITDDFDININDSKITIAPKKLDDDELYGKTYNIYVNTKLKDGFKIEDLEEGINSKFSLIYNGKEIEAYSSINYNANIIENVPDTRIQNRNKVIVSITLICIGIFITVKIIRKYNNFTVKKNNNN